ncbi:MAG TPA: carboxypeptidase-like regulatory domain-containing protein, partial [Candidatus Polarisedimenticolia bacterium]|nr:carboxypeptidase-like regulatory domain-containing protein [Candidatus Polarisedimenticolia bacterium]
QEGDVREAARSWRSQKLRSTNGVFRLPGQAAGDYNLLVVTQTHQDLVREGIEIPRDRDLGDLELERGTWIHGQVRDGSGAPLEAMEVHLVPVRMDAGHSPPQRRIAATDGTGAFEFTKLPPGLSRMAVGDLRAPEEEHPEFYLGRDQELDKSFQIPRRTTVRVLTQTMEGSPIPRALVTLTMDGIQKRARSDGGGWARVPFVRGGSYKLMIQAPTFLPYEEELQVGEGSPLLEITRSLQRIQ